MSDRLSILCCNQSWFVNELQQRGHRVVTCGAVGRGCDIEFDKTGTTFESILRNLPRSFIPDRLIWFDDSGPVWLRGVEDLEIPTLFYAVDAHHHVAWHKYFGAAFDKVFVAQRDYAAAYLEGNPTAEWMPLWAPIELAPQPERTIDVSFRGNFDETLHPERVKFFRELRELVPVDAGMGTYADIYTISKIVINQAVKNDFNFRVFEAIASGALLITPHVDNGLLDLFIPDVDLVTYASNDVQEAAEKIRYYLSHDDEREQIARSGYEKLRREHTAKRRAEQIEECLLSLRVTERPVRYFGMAASQLACSFLMRPKSEAMGDSFLRMAADSIVKSVEAKERTGELIEELLMQCKCALDQREAFYHAYALCTRLAELRPHSQVFELVAKEATEKLREVVEKAKAAETSR